MDLSHPAIQSSLLPLLTAFALGGMLRLLGGSERGPRLAAAGIGLAFVLVVLVVLGVPAWPPRAAAEKLPYIVAAGTLLGLVMDLRDGGRLAGGFLALLWPLPLLFWLGWAFVERDDTAALLELALLAVGSALVLWRLSRAREEGLVGPAMCLAACVGLGGVALLSASISLAQLGFALAAALGGYMLWNWPRSRFTFGLAGVLGAGGALVALVAQTVLLTPARPAAVAMLLPIFLADRVSRRLPPAGSGPLRQALEPVYLLLVAAIPVALAWVLSQGGAESQDPYY